MEIGPSLTRNNAPADSGAVRRLIDALQNERVTKFVEDVASNLPKYGLDKPHLQLTFSSFASENTAETKAGEEPFATLAFGKEDGDNVYARLTDEPFVVAVRRGLVDQISTDPLQWQELSIFKFKPEEIHRLSIMTDKELSLERGENNQWHWLKGTGEIDGQMCSRYSTHYPACAQCVGSEQRSLKMASKNRS